MKENGNNGLRAKTNEYLTKLRREGQPVWFYKVVGSAFSRAGVADFLIVYDGRPGALELKRTGESLTTTCQGGMNKQTKEAFDFGYAGGMSGWTDSMEGVKSFVDGLRSGLRGNLGKFGPGNDLR
jgi:hypothetical protein